MLYLPRHSTLWLGKGRTTKLVLYKCRRAFTFRKRGLVCCSDVLSKVNKRRRANCRMVDGTPTAQELVTFLGECSLHHCCIAELRTSRIPDFA